jgi:hypothetical protein
MVVVDGSEHALFILPSKYLALRYRDEQPQLYWKSAKAYCVKRVVSSLFEELKLLAITRA